MRELHAWHSDRSHPHDAPADTPATRPHDSPKHVVLRDPADRIAKHLEYRKTVEAGQANYAARHAKPEEAKPEHTPSETRDGAASKIAERQESLEDQGQKRRRPERSRLPSNETAQLVVGVSVVASSVAGAINVLPGRWDAVAASVVGAVAAGVAWGNKRWKDKHGNRPED